MQKKMKLSPRTIRRILGDYRIARTLFCYRPKNARLEAYRRNGIHLPPNWDYWKNR